MTDDGSHRCVSGRWTPNRSRRSRLAAAPIEVEIEPGHAPDPGARQRALDRRLAQDLEWARWAVERWAAFPVDRDPRPLVLADSVDRVDGGFASSEGKLAYIEGMIEADVPVPEPVLALLRQRPNQPLPPRTGETPLVITAAAQSETEFLTDRGQRLLPAWRLQADGLQGQIWVLDPGIASAAWRPQEPPPTPRPAHQPSGGDPVSHVLATQDGRTLTFSFTGDPPSYTTYPRAEVVRSRRAVAIVPVAKDVGPSGPRRLPGYTPEVIVRLDEPIGARVFVDLHGNPGEVRTTAAPDRGLRGTSVQGVV